jgi:hypothetical protein
MQKPAGSVENSLTQYPVSESTSLVYIHSGHSAGTQKTTAYDWWLILRNV